MRRETILHNLMTRIATITVANGFSWEPAERYEWLATPQGDDGSALPSIVFNDTRDRYDTQASASHTHKLTVEIGIWMAESTNTAPKLRQAIADVLQVLSASGSDDTGDYLDVVETEVEIEQSEQILGLAHIELLVTYETPKWEI